MAFIFADALSYAGPPKCGTTWFLHSVMNAGLPTERKASTMIHQIGPRSLNGKPLPTVTTIRDPAEWLRSYYQNMQGRLANEPIVDRMQSLDWGNPPSFQAFVNSYFERMPGHVTAIFDAYAADYTVKIGDADRLVEVLTELGLTFKRGAVLDTEVPNPTRDLCEIPDDIRRRIYEVDAKVYEASR